MAWIGCAAPGSSGAPSSDAVDATPRAPGDAGAAACGVCEVPVGSGCQGVGPTRCVAGWTGDGGCGCQRDLPPCDPGAIWDAEGTCLPAGPRQAVRGLVPAAEAGRFPAPPPGATSILFVDAKAAIGGDGASPGAALRSLSEATAQADDGATILVAAGTYAEPVRLVRPVQVIGAGSHRVRVTGASTGTLVWPQGSAKHPAVAIQAGGDLPAAITLQGLTVATDGIGVALVNAGPFTLRDVRVERASGIGLLAAGEGYADLEDLFVGGVTGSLDQGAQCVRIDIYATVLWRRGEVRGCGAGPGITVRGEAFLSGSDVTVAETRGSAVRVVHGGIRLDGAVIAGAAQGPDPAEPGAGVRVEAGQAFLDNAEIVGGTVGILAFGSVAALTATRIAGQRPDVSGFSAGVVALDTTVTARRLRVEDIDGVGLAHQGDAALRLSASDFRTLRLGLFLDQAGDVEIDTVRVADVREAGVHARGATVRLADSVLEQAPTSTDAFGVLSMAGSNVAVTRTLIRGAFLAGVGVDSASLNLTDSEVRGDGTLRFGILTSVGTVFVGSTTVRRPLSAGLASYAGSDVTLDESVVRESSVDPDLGVGFALLCEGSALTVRRTLVADATHAAANLTRGCRGVLDVVRLERIRLAHHPLGAQGEGIRVTLGATAIVQSALIRDAGRAGILVDGTGTDQATGLVLGDAHLSGNAVSVALQSGGTLTDAGGNVIAGNDRDDILQDGGLWVDPTRLPPIAPAPAP